jgi:hypothetical protein
LTTFNFEQLLMDACWKHGVFFAWVGIFIIERNGIAKALNELPPQVRVLGLGAFTFDGRSIESRTDYVLPDFGSGKTINEALAMIADWPRNEGLWIEPTLSSGIAPWS